MPRTSERTEMALLPIGARVRLMGGCEGLGSGYRAGRTGTIRGYEYQAPGVLSGIPYRVDWDDERVFGIWPVWPRPEYIERLEEAEHANDEG